MGLWVGSGMTVEWVWGVLEVVGWVFGASGPQNRSKIDYAHGLKNLLLGRNFDFLRKFFLVCFEIQRLIYTVFFMSGGRF